MRHYNRPKSIFLLILVAVSYLSTAQSFSPINVNNTPVISTCTIGSFGDVTIKVPTEALTGDNILLNINLPATSSGCSKTVTITSSQNLDFVSSVIPFVGSGTVFTNAAVLDPINGQNFNVIYKFPGAVTCNGASGSFTVKVQLDCAGVITQCESTVNITARAGNYWTISKQFESGDLTCGQSSWNILLSHNNPNSYGLGTYNLDATVTDNTSLPVISPVVPVNLNFQWNTFQTGGDYVVIKALLQNCQQQGTIITNTADYHFNLGNGCEIKDGTISARSAPLQSPNASISFDKIAEVSSNTFSPGCIGHYNIKIYNNGNSPWTNFTITDDLTIPGITITSIQLNGWTQTPSLLSGPVSFTKPGLVLNPGQLANLFINFIITGNPGTIVNNTATLSYAGGGGSGSGGGSSACPGINCPVINTSIQNKTAPNTFTIAQPEAVPSIVKCNETISPPIKQVGGSIKFRIQVANEGPGPLNTTINDALGSSPQNLEIIGTPTFTYYANQGPNYCGSVFGTGVISPMGSWDGNPVSPVFTVTNLPGICSFGQSNILVIEFEAVIKPQLSGSKTNTVIMDTRPPLSAEANYTIDKVGELKIRKTTDMQMVANGGNFNYLITVTNVGSHPLNNIIVTDMLPNCVTRNGNITIKKGNAIISSTTTGNIEITVNPSDFIDPGESYVITIPIKKISSNNCCNNAASATAKLVTDGNLINANTPANEPVCVVNPLCCDIPDLQVELTPSSLSGTNLFTLNINAGVVPVQEIEVSMVDYHVQYSNEECKPANMGIFGNLFTRNINIGGLALNGNRSQSLSWIAGTPVVLNQSIRFTVSKPGISQLDCCNGVFFFCLKVWIKNVNCMVCEKVVCGSYTIKNNNHIINPSKGLPYLQPVQIRPELREQYEKMLIDQQQKLEIEQFERQQQKDGKTQTPFAKPAKVKNL